MWRLLSHFFMKGLSVKTLLRCSALFLVVFALARPAGAATTRIEVRALLVSGTHVENGSTSTVSLAPAPMLRVTTSEKRWALFAEFASSLGHRPIGSAGMFNNSPTNIQASVFNAALRYRINAMTSIGIGETIVNQDSNYPPNGLFSEPFAQASRVVGMRYEIRSEIYSTVHSRWHVDLAVNPHLSANLVQYEPTNDADGDEGVRFFAPEVGSQVDASLSNRVRNRRYSLTYGIRYVNLSMFFPYHRLADRDAVVIPFIGIARSFGH